MTTYIEWGIAHRSTPDRAHAGPFSFADAIRWLAQWNDDGGDPREFKLVRREATEWIGCDDYLPSEITAMKAL